MPWPELAMGEREYTHAPTTHPVTCARLGAGASLEVDGRLTCEHESVGEEDVFYISWRAQWAGELIKEMISGPNLYQSDPVNAKPAYTDKVCVLHDVSTAPTYPCWLCEEDGLLEEAA